MEIPEEQTADEAASDDAQQPAQHEQRNGQPGDTVTVSFELSEAATMMLKHCPNIQDPQTGENLDINEAAEAIVTRWIRNNAQL